MSKRVTITRHDYELIQWLVMYYKEYGILKFPAIQNLNELLAKLEVKK